MILAVEDADLLLVAVAGVGSEVSFNDKLVTADDLGRLGKTWQKPDNCFSSFGHSLFVESNQNLFTQLLGPLCLLQCIYVPMGQDTIFGNESISV